MKKAKLNIWTFVVVLSVSITVALCTTAIAFGLYSKEMIIDITLTALLPYVIIGMMYITQKNKKNGHLKATNDPTQ
ncbi:MAG: hypothetical protein RQ756_01835 [Flavobacteriaceae bacterium]|nr:hypothetical protein [Flavobacteriaceae bacterium]